MVPLKRYSLHCGFQGIDEVETVETSAAKVMAVLPDFKCHARDVARPA